MLSGMDHQKNMLIIYLILAALLGLLIVLGAPALYDLTRRSFLDLKAESRPVLNLVKVRKIDLSSEYVGGANFFHTVDGKGRIIHFSSEFNEELTNQNLALAFFDIPDDCSGCTEYMFHLKNTNNKTIKNVKIKIKIGGKVAEPIFKFALSAEQIATSQKRNGDFYEMTISQLSALETMSFATLANEPGDLVEAFCEVSEGTCALNHLEISYSDIVSGGGKVYLTYNGKEYPLPEVNISSEPQDYQLINGVWTRYK